MGTWKSARGYVSDEMADILDAAFDKIGALSTEPTMIDLKNAIEFVSRGGRIVDPEEPDPDRGEVVVVNDEIADIVRKAVKKIRKLPSRWGTHDIADGIEFATRGSLRVDLLEGPGFKVSLHQAADELGIMPVANIGNECCFETIPNRGQIQG